MMRCCRQRREGETRNVVCFLSVSLPPAPSHFESPTSLLCSLERARREGLASIASVRPSAEQKLEHSLLPARSLARMLCQTKSGR